jgi:hypothetical protein
MHSPFPSLCLSFFKERPFYSRSLFASNTQKKNPSPLASIHSLPKRHKQMPLSVQSQMQKSSLTHCADVMLCKRCCESYYQPLESPLELREALDDRRAVSSLDHLGELISYFELAEGRRERTFGLCSRHRMRRTCMDLRGSMIWHCSTPLGDRRAL